MNKQEKTIAILLGLCLAGWLWYSVTEQKKAAEAAREAMAAQAAAQAQSATAAVKADNVAAKPAEPVKPAEQQVKKAAYLKPEKLEQRLQRWSYRVLQRVL